jgi:hypothetical protein
VAPIKFGLDDKKVPTVGARPPLEFPPHVGLLIRDEILRTTLGPFDKTIVYNTKTFYFLKYKFF